MAAITEIATSTTDKDENGISTVTKDVEVFENIAIDDGDNEKETDVEPKEKKGCVQSMKNCGESCSDWFKESVDSCFMWAMCCIVCLISCV
jgi:hypothetical protein